MQTDTTIQQQLHERLIFKQQNSFEILFMLIDTMRCTATVYNEIEIKIKPKKKENT